MRHAFVKALIEEAKKNPRIMLITADLGFRILDPFKDQFPKQYLNVGVAESNLILVAAGLSSLGYIPFAYSIANFASMRPYEQIRNVVCLQKTNVKIVAVGGGLAYNKAGPTHHTFEDIAIMRALSGMTVVSPSDKADCYQATKKIISHQGPVYMRIERDPIGYVKPRFQLGKGQVIKKGKDVAILTTGTNIFNALLISKTLEKRAFSAGIYSFPTIQPLDKKLLKLIADEYPVVVSLEEHRIDGGLGTAIAEYFSDLSCLNRLIRYGLRNELPTVSSNYESLLEYHRFTPGQIARSLIRILEKEK